MTATFSYLAAGTRREYRCQMRIVGAAEIIIAIGAAVFAFVVATSHRAHKTRLALVSSIFVSVILLAWDRYLYVSTSRGLLDTATCWFTPTARPCLDLESGGSVAEAATSVSPVSQNVIGNFVEPPAPVASENQDQEHTISLDDRNAKSIWTTSVYSYAPGGGRPGGGLADGRLRVGGWGDTYVSLIAMPIEQRGRSVRRAILSLNLREDDPRSSPTPMRLMRITQGWNWRAGSRLWWRDAPHAEFVSNLPAPSILRGEYEIDLTALYNQWALNQQPNFGIMLAPVLTNNNFTTFYSTRAEPALRPVLRLTY